MLLSIGMIVKNEEKYLRRCLEALSPILSKVDSELIIVDTGSTDQSVNIAREFTDKVFFFQWCDDFAAARNAAMKRAKGRWYMSIDADEILEDPRELIDFFNTGEYKKYNAAAYIIRSFNKVTLKASADINALRLIKIDSDSYYVNPIHEQFECIYEPIKYLSVVAEHYGYVTEDNEEYISFKMERNLKIMLSELEKKPRSSLLYLYISQTYRILNDREKALEYCDKGIICARSQNDPVLYSIYANKLGIFFETHKYLEIISLADEYFSNKKTQNGTDVEFYFTRAESYLNLGQFNEAAAEYSKYFIFLKEFKQGKHRTVDTLHHSVSFINDLVHKIAILNCVKSLINLKRYDEAVTYLHSLPDEDFINEKGVDIKYWLSLKFLLMEKQNDFSHLPTLYQLMQNHQHGLIYDYIEKEINKAQNLESILNAFAGPGNDDDTYISFIKLRGYFQAGTLDKARVIRFLSGIGEMSPLYADIAYYAIMTGVPLNAITEKIKPEEIESCFYNNGYFHYKELVYALIDSSINADQLNAYNQLWLSSLYYCELISNRLLPEMAEKVFYKYSESIFDAMSKILKAEYLSEEKINMLPRQYRLGYYCHETVKAIKAGQEVSYVKLLRTVLKLDPNLSNVIKIMLNSFQAKKDAAEKRMSEFEEYAAQVKSAISSLIESGQLEQAGQFLKTYETLCPDDPEIGVLKSRMDISR